MFKIYAQRVFSSQWNDSVNFYQDKIGLPLIFSDADIGWAEFDLHGAALAIERVEKDSEEAEMVGRFVGLSIEVEDIYSLYNALVEKGVRFISPPEKQPWGGVLAHFKDPDENVITLLGRDA